MSDTAPGHNNPPTDADPLRERFAETYADMLKRSADLEAALARVPVELDEDSAPKAVDYVRMVKAVATAAETARKKEKEPFLSAGKTVDAWFGEIASLMTRCATSVEQRITALQARKREEERKRLEAEAKAARAAAQAAKVDEEREVYEQQAARAAVQMADSKAASRVGGSLGMAASRTTTTFALVDRAKLPVKFLRQYVDEEAIIKAARAAYWAGVKEIAGIEIKEEERTYVR